MATKKRKKKIRNVVAGGKPHTITIVVDNNDNITGYKQAPPDNGNDDGKHVKADPTDTITWRCRLPFVIFFAKDGSPFNEIVFGGLAGGSSGTGVVRPVGDTYHYWVFVVTNSGVKSDDPDIIVT